MSKNTKPPVIDKSTWGDGPWQSEPDRVEFIAHGFACLIQRNPHGGHFYAYVGVPNDHPAYGKRYQHVGVSFHGDLAYSNKCAGVICHVPQPGMPDDVWWLGGHFGHCWDLAPGMRAVLKGLKDEHGELLPARLLPPIPEMPEVYRDLAYVREQTEYLAAQLAEMGGAT